MNKELIESLNVLEKEKKLVKKCYLKQSKIRL